MGETFRPTEDVHKLTAIDMSKPFPCFRFPKDPEPITLEQTLQAEYEL